MRVLKHSLSAAAVVLLAAACASSGGRSRAQEPTTLVVRNQSQYDMTIYAIRDNGQRVRIGRATSYTDSRMRIPNHLIFGVTTLRFLADPLATNGSPISNSIVVTPGEEITLTIPPA